MNEFRFESIPMDQLGGSERPQTDWLWKGFLARGSVTLLTSTWKAGKTTLATGLLRHLGSGRAFLSRPCARSRVLYVSEEDRGHWDERTRERPVGAHAQLILRPFVSQPQTVHWEALIEHAAATREAGAMDLLVLDPLAEFLPNRCESHAGTLLEALRSLHRLTSAGAAVLLLHHPRKATSEEGSTARGSGALLGFVDMILEIHRQGRDPASCRRRLVGLSRFAETPRQLAYEWDPLTEEFRTLTVLPSSLEEAWEVLKVILARQPDGMTQDQVAADWPVDQTEPSRALLYKWLIQAMDHGLVRREGGGRKSAPYRYRLPNELDRLFESFGRV